MKIRFVDPSVVLTHLCNASVNAREQYTQALCKQRVIWDAFNALPWYQRLLKGPPRTSLDDVFTCSRLKADAKTLGSLLEALFPAIDTDGSSVEINDKELCLIHKYASSQEESHES